MLIGERIKRIRSFRGLTQAEFGIALGFDAKNAAVRVAQYESNYRAPKEDMINQMANILKANPAMIKSYSDISEDSIFVSLFWLEEEKGYDVMNLTQLSDVYSADEVVNTYDETKALSTLAPVSLLFNDEKMNTNMHQWYLQKQKLDSGEISEDEYFEWKITWPHP